MGVRKKPEARCPRCLMRREACLCKDLPLLRPATHVVVVATKREVQVPTGTGRLATQALQGSALLVRGDPTRPYDLGEHLIPGRPAFILYPEEGATLLTDEFARGLPAAINLVVPDGNWRQTVKMRRRDPVMAGLPALTLPPLGPSAYAVRHEAKAGGLATIEAIARALGILEGEAPRAALEAVFMRMVARTLASRGAAARPAPSPGAQARPPSPPGL